MTNGMTETNNQTNNQASPKGSKRETGKSIKGMQLKPAVDIKPGQYPARLMDFSDIYELPSKFAKGTSGYSAKMDLVWALRVGDTVRIQRSIVSPPNGFLSNKSTLWKYLRVLAGGDSGLWDGGQDNVREDIAVDAFLGRTCNVVVETDKNGYTRVTSAVLPPDGMNFPSAEEAQAALARGEETGSVEDDEHARDAR
jgi:hypothetical protein